MSQSDKHNNWKRNADQQPSQTGDAPTPERDEQRPEQKPHSSASPSALQRWKRRASVVLIVLISLAAGYGLKVGLSKPGSAASSTAAGAGSAVAETGAETATEWTCSMHPEVRQSEPGLCPKCGMDLIPAEESSSEGPLRQFATTEAGRALMDIRTSPVERRFVEAQTRMVGKIDYDETKVAYITSWFPGRLDRLFVDYTGVNVEKGDHLAKIYSPELLSAQEELIQAAQAAQDLRNGDMEVMRKTTLATLQAAREKLRLWGLTDQQIEQIEQRGTASDHMTIYAPISGVVIHKNAQEGMYVETGTKIYTIADLSKVWVKLDAYESDLDWLRYGQKVEFTTVSHPGETFTGTVTFIDPVLTSDTRTVKVRVIADNDAGRLKPGMFVKAVAQANVATGGRVRDAALAGKWISPMHPEIVKDGPGECDVCGMPLVPAEKLGYVGEHAAPDDKPLVIPASAVLKTGTRAVVYVEVPGKDKPTFEGREIVLGPRAGDWYVVESGLAEDEMVVTRGNFKIDSALQISARPSMMSPDAGVGGKAIDPNELPALFRHHARKVVEAARDACELAAAGDLQGAKQAFARMDKLLEASEAEDLSGEAARLWREVRMRLSNHAAEGARLSATAEVKQLGEKLAEDLQLVQRRFVPTGEAPATGPAVPTEFAEQLAGVFDAYVQLQQALAEDDAIAAGVAVRVVSDKLAEVDMKLLSGPAHMQWMKHAEALEQILTEAGEAEGIEPLRKQFSRLSQELLTVADRFGTGGRTLYQAHCPMAFNNAGADWIQTDQDVQNPYYGQSMLGCGEIAEVLAD
ncbi:MAG: efflux RND transporter periplasmic adaptor subunit [Planctomycetota bacterium]